MRNERGRIPGVLISLALVALLAWIAEAYVRRAAAQNAEPPENARPVVIAPAPVSKDDAESNEAETGPRRARRRKRPTKRRANTATPLTTTSSFPVDI
jgi:hypothetical protein